MLRRPVFFLIAVVMAAALPGSVLGAGTLDQQQTTHDGFAANTKTCIAQTFTAGQSGRLDRVSLYVRKLTDHPIMLVQLRETSGGSPDGMVMASSTVSGSEIASTFGWIDFEFDDPPIVLAGTVYGIAAPPLGPMGPDADPWGFEWGGAEQTVSVDPYPGGYFHSATSCDGPYGAQSADLAFQTFVDSEGAFQPDGRIRVNFGGWTGGNIYNLTGDDQARSRTVTAGNWVVFRISTQNDGFLPDQFVIYADGADVPGYTVRYFKGTREITSRVVAGTFATRRVQPGRRVTIEAWVKPTSSSAIGSSLTRLVTLSSVGQPSEVDAVRFTAGRK